MVANELRSWSPVFDPLKVVIPNLVLMLTAVSSPVLIPEIIDILFFSKVV